MLPRQNKICHSGAREARTRNPGATSAVLAPGFRIALCASGMTKSFSFALAVLALCACASSAPLWRAQDGIDYRVDVVDQPSDRRFELEFVSLADRPLCFSTESWPFRGKVGWGSTQVAIAVGDQRYPIQDWNMGYCPGNECASRVEARGRAHGYLSYDEFPGAPFDGREQSLQFNIGVYACQGGERPV